MNAEAIPASRLTVLHCQQRGDMAVYDQFCATCAAVLQKIPHFEAEDIIFVGEANFQPRIKWCTAKAALNATAIAGCRLCSDLLKWLQVFEEENAYYNGESIRLLREWYEEECGKLVPGDDPPDYLADYEKMEADACRLESTQSFQDSASIELGLKAGCREGAQLPDISEINVCIFHADQWVVLVTLQVTADACDMAARFVSSRPIDLNPMSPRNIALIRSWIQACGSQHASCPSNKAVRLPRRLIDVSGPGCSDSTVKLHVSGEGELGSYLALSYCWGIQQTYILTTQTLASFTSGIELQRLPKTIQDAITVTRIFQYRFLWIDALCIMQDDDVDKLVDIPRMHEIYRNALLTILATRAKVCHDGFLEDRTGLSIPPIILPYACIDDQNGTIRLREALEIDSTSEPLEYRGWTFQERCLSTRALAYRAVVWWRCLGMTRYGPPNCELVRFPETADLVNTQADTVWPKLVHQYSGRALKDSADKLSALAGLAEAVAQRRPVDHYLAGLWESTLLWDLLWRITRDLQEEKPISYRAPSWSWAAVDGPIEMAYSSSIHGDKPPFHPLVMVTDSSISLVSAGSAYGPVRSAVLTMRGNIQRVRHLGVSGYAEVFVDSSATCSSLDAASPVPQGLLAYIDTGSDITRLRKGKPLTSDIVVTPRDLRAAIRDIPWGLEMWALPVLANGVADHSLILEESPNGMFSRVGYFRVPNDSSWTWSSNAVAKTLMII